MKEVEKRAALDRMVDEGFFEEATFKLRAEEVSSVNVWEKNFPGRGNCKRKFLCLMKEQAQGTEKDQDDCHSLCDPGKFKCPSLSVSIKWV